MSSSSKEVTVGGEAEKMSEPLIVCARCEQEYRESENTNEACEWYYNTHKGKFIVNYDSEFWYGWKEWNGPRNTSYCRREFGTKGGFEWTICGCDHNRDECFRVGRHKPEDASLSSGDYEISYHSDESSSSEEDIVDPWTKSFAAARLKELEDEYDEDFDEEDDDSSEDDDDEQVVKKRRVNDDDDGSSNSDEDSE